MRVGAIGAGARGGSTPRPTPGIRAPSWSASLAAIPLARGRWPTNTAPPRPADAAELLEDSSIEAVSICTPTQLHRDLAVAALEQGKHVLCEMPPSQNVADMDRLTRGGRVQPHEID